MSKILFLTNTSAIGGAENQIFNLVKGLKTNFQLDIAFLYKAQNNSLEQKYKQNNINVIFFNQTFKFSILTIYKLVKLIKNYQVIHLNLFQAEIHGLIAAVVAKYSGKIIVSIHNTEHFYKNKLLSILYKLISWRVDKYIAISKAVKTYFTKYTQSPKHKLKVIYYGLSGEKKILRKPNKIKQVALIGRYAPQKGHKYLIQAMPEIIKAIPDVEFLFIGRDEKKMQAQFKRLAIKLKVIDFLKFRTFENDLQNTYSTISILVLPSLWEGFGLVLLEAMLAKVPIVATKVGPIPEIIENNYSGLLVSPKNSRELAQAIIRLLKDQKLQKLLTQNAYQVAQTKFTLQTMVKKHTELYNSLIKS